jgi:hypothetical protein
MASVAQQSKRARPPTGRRFDSGEAECERNCAHELAAVAGLLYPLSGSALDHRGISKFKRHRPKLAAGLPSVR